MAVAIRHSLFCIVDNNGVPISGAKFYIYAATTTTPLTVYSDSGLSTTADNPIVTDSAGVLPLRYIATASYKITATTAAGAALTRYSGDNIDPGVAVGSGALPVASGGTGATSAGSALTNLGAASSASVTNLTSDVTTIQGYHNGTSHMPVSTGTTAQRPGSPAAGYFRINSTTGHPEYHDGSQWRSIFGYPKGTICGAGLSNNGSDATNDIDIAAGTIRDAADTVEIVLGALTKRLDASWSAGTGNGMRSASSIADTTWHIFAIAKIDGTADVLAHDSLDPTLALPSGYTKYRRIGSILRESSSIIGFIQKKNLFVRTTPVKDGNSLSVTTSNQSVALSVPNHFRSEAIVSGWIAATDSVVLSLHPPDASIAVTASSGPGSAGGSISGSGVATTASAIPKQRVLTNTSRQIGYRASSTGTAQLWTEGWWDFLED